MNGLDVNLSLPTIIDPTNPLTRGLIFAAPMDEGAGSVVHDLSGRGNDGAIANTTWTVRGLDFVRANSSSVAATIPHDDVYSVSFWFTADVWDNGDRHAIVAKNDSTDGWFVGDWNDAGRIRFGTNHGNIQSATAIATSRWYHCVIVQRSSTYAEIWIDGQLDNSGNNEYAGYDAAPLRIGRDYTGDEKYFDGRVDDVLVYARSLTSSEIAKLYADPDAWRRQRPPWELWTAATSVSAAADTGFMTTSTGFWGY